jgi:hypothetical protein
LPGRRRAKNAKERTLLSGDQGDRDLAVADLGGFLTVRDRS